MGYRWFAIKEAYKKIFFFRLKRKKLIQGSLFRIIIVCNAKKFVKNWGRVLVQVKSKDNKKREKKKTTKPMR
jgi:hypothetical protein